MRFPSISNVAQELRIINDHFDNDVDVRLQVHEDGKWFIRFGSSDYDQDHRGVWGVASVPGSGRRFKSKEVAKDLIEQCREHYEWNKLCVQSAEG